MRNECLQPKAMAQAKAKPSQAQANSPGLAWDFSRPEPPKARPKPWLSGQAKASTSLVHPVLGHSPSGSEGI